MIEMRVSVILPAAGSGTRMGAPLPKAFMPLAGKPLIAHTIGVFLGRMDVAQIIVPVPASILPEINSFDGIPDDGRIIYVEGGKERLYSIWNALKHVMDVDLVAAHDAVRPFVSDRELDAVFQKAQQTGAAILACKSPNTLKSVDEGGKVESTLDRNKIWQALTPQVFKKEIMVDAYERAIKENRFGTDDASLVEAAGHKVAIVEGSPGNIKLTWPEDIQAAENRLKNSMDDNRIGIGYDVHRLAEGRALILGGVNIPYEKGLDGHSDADVLIHAVIDAITGALALGDIGSHFPDTDRKYKNIDSRILLRNVRELMNQKGYVIGNIDATVVAQRPRLRDYIDRMRENLAEDLSTPVDSVSVKATTSEKIGFVGREEGMSATAVVLLKKR